MGLRLKKYGWHEWLCHTNFSFLVGASHPCEYLERALKHGYRSLAVTDYDGVYGLARAHRNLERLLNPIFEPLEDVRDPASNGRIRKEGEPRVRGGDVCEPAPTPSLKLIHGVELHLQVDHDRPVVFQDTIALIARNRDGYKNLNRLCSYAHRGGKSDAFVPLDYLMQQDVTGLSLIQPMRGVMRGALSQELFRRFRGFKDHFADNFYFAVSRHLNPAEDYWIQPTWRAARRLEVPVLLSQDAYFHEPSQKDMSDLLQAIRTNKTLDHAGHHFFANSERCLHSLEGIEARYGTLPFYEQALRHSRELADQCDFSMSELRYHYPKEMIPEGYTPQSWLQHLVWEGARKHYGDSIPGKVRNLLNKELELIEQLNFADYFLTVWDIVRWGREQNILCQGRGSAANSAVCFVLGVTSVDPTLFDLVFERFISVERGDPPDIDVDFEHERREEVIQYIYQRYGRRQASMVANVITFRSKGALRAVGKALGAPEEMLGAASKILETKYFRRSGSQDVLENVKEDFTESKDDPDALLQGADDLPWDVWAEMAERLRGFPRHLGIHSGGFMLADEPLDNLVAQEPATMENRTVVQWSKDDIEGLGFFKIDVLSLGMLTAIRKCLQYISESYGKELTLSTIPPDDGATYAMIQRADTVGTFQVESRAQMSMLPRLRPRNFYDLVIEVAIIRPGPIQGGMIHPFLRRRNGQEAITFPDDRLRPILSRTLGVPIFQEQVMRIAMEVGGFTGGEANELRKNMGAWTMKGDLTPMLKKLAAGMRGNGIDEDFIQTIIKQMKGFADYGFPESHAVSFALIAYASCYLKCHYPAAFFGAVLNSQPMGFYAPHALLQAAKRDGVKVLPVCVNKSEYDCKLENVATNGRPPVYGLRLGLNMVNSMSESGAKALVAKRGEIGGEWGDLEHFLQTIHLYRNDLTALTAANALQVFGIDRRAALWLAEAAPFCPVIEDVEEVFPWREEGAMERIEQDFASTNTTLGPHPVQVIRDDHWCYEVGQNKLVKGQDIVKVRANRYIDIFGMVLVRQAPPSAKGMVFLTLEDETGFINLAFTPDVYARFYQLVEGQAFLCIRGKVQRTNESHSILVQNVYEPKLERAEIIPLDEDEVIAARAQKMMGPSPDMGDKAVRERKQLVRTRNFH